MDIKQDIIRLGTSYLAARGIDNARQEAVWLFEHVFGKVDNLAYSENDEKAKLDEIARLASLKNTKRYNELITRRCAGEPLQYLLGEWEFYGYPMKVGKGVLIPRPETEFLVDIGIDYLEYKGYSEPQMIIDLCAGSGCVGIAMAKKAGCKAIAVELSEDAARFAADNIKLNQAEEYVTLYNSDIFDEEFIDSLPEVVCIFANPPYLSIEDMKNLQREVSFEPEMALYGGKDGLDYYRRIFTLWKKKLADGGLFAVEVGDEQAEAVAALMEQSGFHTEIMKDYAGIGRIVYSSYKNPDEEKERLAKLLAEQERLKELHKDNYPSYPDPSSDKREDIPYEEKIAALLKEQEKLKELQQKRLAAEGILEADKTEQTIL